MATTTNRTYARVITVMGSPSVGKSALMIRYLENTFNDDYSPTFYKANFRDMQYNGNTYKLTILDTAGSEPHTPIPTNYITNTNGYILVYSITDRQSFDIIKDIYNKLYDAHNKAIPVVLVGNKSDLNNERRVQLSEGESLAKQWRAPFIETSAKMGEKVRDIFISCLNVIDADSYNTNNTTNANNNQRNNQQQQQQSRVQQQDDKKGGNNCQIC